MSRTARWSLVLALLLVPSCQQEPTAPGADPQYGRGNPEPPPPVIPSDWLVLDLDAGLPSAAHAGYGLSDDGWAFVEEQASSTNDLAYLTTESPIRIETLPGPVGGGGLGNGYGDYITYPDRLLLHDGAGHWLLGPQFPLPAGWTALSATGVNNSRVVVGRARDPGRTYATRQTSGSYFSPLVWLDGASATSPVVPLTLPVASAGCKVTHVFATAVNNPGRIVGYAQQEAVVSKATCVRRALYWDPPYGDPTNFPGELFPSPDPMKDPYSAGKGTSYALNYTAEDINDAGDVAGGLFVDVSASYRAVRWMNGSYQRPEVLTGWIVTGLEIDECGRMLVGGVSYGALPGIWPMGWDGKLTLPLPSGITLMGASDFRNGRVIGTGSPTGTTGQRHALVWTLDACPGHWPAS